MALTFMRAPGTFRRWPLSDRCSILKQSVPTWHQAPPVEYFLSCGNILCMVTSKAFRRGHCMNAWLGRGSCAQSINFRETRRTARVAFRWRLFTLTIPCFVFPKDLQCWIHRVKNDLPCLLKFPVIYSQWLLAAYRYRFNTERDKVRSRNSLFNYREPSPFSRVALASRNQSVS